MSCISHFSCFCQLGDAGIATSAQIGHRQAIISLLGSSASSIGRAPETPALSRPEACIIGRGLGELSWSSGGPSAR